MVALFTVPSREAEGTSAEGTLTGNRARRRTFMELKLEVPWQTELLLVPRCEVTAAVIGQRGSPHVQIDGGDVIVRGFFRGGQ